MAQTFSHPFGIIMAAHPGDALLAKACLASINMFLPDMPICIIADGGLDVSSWKRLYRIVKVITPESTESTFFKKFCFGTRMTQVLPFWVSPFEKFLYLDADTLVWGDILKGVDLSDAPFIHNIPHEPYTREIYLQQYFDFEKIFEHTRHFEWRPYHYFNAGVFIGQRNLFDLQEFIELVMLWKQFGNKMIFDSQGVLNILVFRGVAEGRFRVKEIPLQTIIPVVTREELEKDFRIENGEPLLKTATILHWAGEKPWLRNKHVFQKPEIFFREQHLKNEHRLGRVVPFLSMYTEEYQTIFNHYYKGSVMKLLGSKLSKA